LQGFHISVEGGRKKVHRAVTALLACPSFLSRPYGAPTTMTTVLAYLDPGSGSMILQILAGGLAAVAVTAKLYWNRLLKFLRIKKDEPETAKADAAPRSSDAA
jgi:hypothetical protein